MGQYGRPNLALAGILVCFCILYLREIYLLLLHPFVASTPDALDIQISHYHLVT